MALTHVCVALGRPHVACTTVNIDRVKDLSLILLPPTKEVHVFAHLCLSVCLLARLHKNVCMDLDEMLRVDRYRDMDELVNF